MASTTPRGTWVPPGSAEGQPFIVMEYVEGLSLQPGANCQIGLSAAVFEVLIPLPECATSLSYSFI